MGRASAGTFGWSRLASVGLLAGTMGNTNLMTRSLSHVSKRLYTSFPDHLTAFGAFSLPRPSGHPEAQVGSLISRMSPRPSRICCPLERNTYALARALIPMKSLARSSCSVMCGRPSQQAKKREIAWVRNKLLSVARHL
jgi:hypothetical protein